VRFELNLVKIKPKLFLSAFTTLFLSSCCLFGKDDCA